MVYVDASNTSWMIAMGARPDTHEIVNDWEFGLLYRDGRFQRLLESGRHRLRWPMQTTRRQVWKLRRGEQLLQFPPADVVSEDKLLYRIAATLTFEIVEPRVAFEQSYMEKLRTYAQGAILRLAAERSLDAMIVERLAAQKHLLELLSEAVTGCRVAAVDVLTLTLPPELRRLYAETERARLEGLASLERARGEQAALRALNNAARMLKGNPELMNLRLLQAITGAGGKSQPTLVLGAETGIRPVRSDPEPDEPSS